MFKKIKSTLAQKLPLFQLRFDEYEIENDDRPFTATVFESRDASNVIAVTSSSEIIMVKQFRYGIEEYTLELPGGLVDEGETHMQAAIRELEEETGYTGTDWEFFTKIAQQPVFIDSYIHTFYCKNAKLEKIKKMDHGEHTEVVLISTTDLKKMLMEDSFIHPHAYSALAKFFLHLEFEY
jgi:ADP-ribose pyrophosphatase